MTTETDLSLPVAIGSHQLFSLITGAESRPVLLIDLRPRHHYRRGHIAGSHSIPSGVLLSGELPDGELILISQSPREAAAVVDALHEAGYHQRLHYLNEGFLGWHGCGLPVQVAVEPRPYALANGLLTTVLGAALLVVAALLTSLPWLGLGSLLIWGAWFEPALPGLPRRQRLI